MFNDIERADLGYQTIIEITVPVLIALAILMVLGLVARRKRTEHRRNSGREIRHDAAAKVPPLTPPRMWRVDALGLPA